VTAQIWIAGFVGVAAIIDDLARRRIANWIPCFAFLSGLALQSVQNGWRGAGSALLGTITGAAVFLIFYLLGGMGGGDVKLMAGFGAVLGVKTLLEAALWTAGCGGVMALLVISAGYVRQLWKKRRSGASETAVGKVEPVGEVQDQRRADSIPYAPAIAMGVWLSLVPKT
jgi:prepilin peptidase CpaA